MANKSQKQKSILKITESQKQPEITESQTNSNNITIQYRYFEDIHTFNLAFNVLLASTGWMISQNQFRNDRFNLSTYDTLNRHKNFQLYLKGLKEWFKFYKILKSYEYHYNLYKQSKQSLLQQCGKFDKITNQYVIYEDQNKINFQLDIDKLHRKVIQLNSEKLSPKFFIMDFIEIFRSYVTRLYRAGGGDGGGEGIPIWYVTKHSPQNTLVLYDVLNDIFNLSEIDTWETTQNLEDEIYNNMLNQEK